MSAIAPLLAAAEGAGEPSHVPFYIAGGLLVAWAVIVALIGTTRPDFPVRRASARGAMLLSVVLVAGAMSTAVLTS